jgi:hypothetical protein
MNKHSSPTINDTSTETSATQRHGQERLWRLPGETNGGGPRYCERQDRVMMLSSAAAWAVLRVGLEGKNEGVGGEEDAMTMKTGCWKSWAEGHRWG